MLFFSISLIFLLNVTLSLCENSSKIILTTCQKKLNGLHSSSHHIYDKCISFTGTSGDEILVLNKLHWVGTLVIGHDHSVKQLH